MLDTGQTVFNPVLLMLVLAVVGGFVFGILGAEVERGKVFALLCLLWALFVAVIYLAFLALLDEFSRRVYLQLLIICLGGATLWVPVAGMIRAVRRL